MPKVDVFVVRLGENAFAPGLKLVAQLRGAGFSTLMSSGSKSLKAQLREANNRGAATVLIVGDNELAEGVVTRRDMASGEQVSIPMRW